MTVYIAHLVHPDKAGKHRFLWKANGQAVAILRYDKDGVYTGASRIAIELGRAAWMRKVEQGWERQMLTGADNTLTPDDKSFSDYLY